MPTTSTKPYLLRAIFEWCTDSGFTPYLAVMVDEATRVPTQFVKNGQIVLNISYGATSGLKMENDAISFKARFGGVSRDIFIPVENVIALYASENGEGMAFEAPTPNAHQTTPAATEAPPTLRSVPVEDSAEKGNSVSDTDDPPEPPKGGVRPALTRVK
ncbi:MAG: ClpXP protease specificity-enhancing factor [Burkholderiaceae bacterium]|nr:ClpXP protease specificity-enhancing factor [Burkholderiaceae bacterium]